MKKLSLLIGLLIATVQILSAQVLAPKELQSKPTYFRYTNAHREPDQVYKFVVPEINRIPDDFDKLKNLQVLEIGVDGKDPDLKELPQHFYNLKKLTHLAIEHTEIINVASSLQNFKNLRFLSLKNNKISHLPKEIGNLEQLDTLYAGNIILPREILKSNIRVLQTTRKDVPIILTLEELIYEGDTIPKDLNRYPNLKKIILTSAKINTRQVIEQIQTKTKVTHIGVNAKACDRYVWEKLSRMPWVRRLEIKDVNYFSPELMKIKGLLELKLTDFQCYDRTGCAGLIEHVAKMESVYKLTVNRFVYNLDELAKLRIVNIENSSDYKSLSGKKWMNHLCKLPNLEELSLYKTDLSGATELYFDSLMNVKVLNLAYTQLPYSSDALVRLSRMQKLEKLIVSSEVLDLNMLAQEWEAVGKVREMIVYNIAARGRMPLSDAKKKLLAKLMPRTKIIYIE